MIPPAAQLPLTKEILPPCPTTGQGAEVHTDPSPAPVALGTPSYFTAPPATYLDVAIGGEYAAVRSTQGGDPAPREWRRGNVTTFTPRSRSRMLQKMAKTDTRGDPPGITFITLTYPDEWPADRLTYKRDLDDWFKRLIRAYPEAWALWRLEYQERGAPHFHILVFGPVNLSWEWAKLAWTGITGDSSIAHYTYGCRVDPLDSWQSAGGYCSKYSAKLNTVEGPPECGRCWGIRGRKNRHEAVYRVAVTEDEFYRIRRLFKRIINAPHGYYDRGGRRWGVWARVANRTATRALEWATSARPSHPPEWVDPETGQIYGLGRQPDDIGRSNTAGRLVSTPTPSDRTRGRLDRALYDDNDRQRLAARRCT